MSIYTLTATGSGVTKRDWFHADSDHEAVFAAVPRILSKAQHMTEPWATGRIELKQRGRVVRVMEAKS